MHNFAMQYILEESSKGLSNSILDNTKTTTMSQWNSTGRTEGTATVILVEGTSEDEEE